MKLFRYGFMGACALLFSAVSLPVFALQNFTGRVTSIEITYMPTSIRFRMDKGNVVCPAGAALTWQNPNAENNKAVYSALATALAGGHQVLFYINDDDATCVGRFIYLVPA